MIWKINTLAHLVERYHGVEGEHELECLHMVEGYHNMQRQGPVNPARKFLDVLSGCNMWKTPYIVVDYKLAGSRDKCELSLTFLYCAKRNTALKMRHR